MERLNDELKEEMIEALDFTINSGYYNEEDIAELATEHLEEIFSDYELNPPSQEVIKQFITEIRNNKIVDISHQNYKRLREVFDQLNRERIIAVEFAGFDMSEGHEEVGEVFQFMKTNNIPRNGYCFYHQQDIERSMDSSIQSLYLAFHSTDGDETKALMIGKRVVELLKAAGFTVSWDETLDQRICIQNFQWDKVFDHEDAGSERAIRIIGESNLLNR